MLVSSLYPSHCRCSRDMFDVIASAFSQSHRATTGFVSSIKAYLFNCCTASGSRALPPCASPSLNIDLEKYNS